MSHPVDPAIEARSRGRFILESSKKSKSPRRHGRPQKACAPADDDLAAYDIPTFCRKHKISESFYFKLRLQGLAPQTIKLGKRVLISKESASRWRAERETASRTEAA